MRLTIEEAEKMMRENGGNLDLRGTKIKELPRNLTVKGNLDLSNTLIESLPENMTCYSGAKSPLAGESRQYIPGLQRKHRQRANMYLRGTKLT